MSAKKSHVLLTRPGFAPALAQELRSRFGLAAATAVGDAAVALPPTAKLPAVDATVFARQLLPNATHAAAPSVEAAARLVVDRLEVLSQRANRQTGRWTLHVYAQDDDPAVQRAVALDKAIRGQTQARLSRLAKRYVEPSELTAAEGATPDDLVVQVYLPEVDALWLSVATVGAGVSPWIAGNRRLRQKAGAPSRSARKLEEAFLELGREPRAGETAVDLGAAPGGWTFALARHGATVTAVDHAALALPESKALLEKVTHLADNGLRYMPPLPVDWLCCDMVVAPAETLKVLARWLEADAMRHYVVNVKLPQADIWPVVAEALASIERAGWPVAKARHLYHDRREITLLGSKDAKGSEP